MGEHAAKNEIRADGRVHVAQLARRLNRKTTYGATDLSPERQGGTRAVHVQKIILRKTMETRCLRLPAIPRHWAFLGVATVALQNAANPIHVGCGLVNFHFKLTHSSAHILELLANTIFLLPHLFAKLLVLLLQRFTEGFPLLRDFCAAGFPLLRNGRFGIFPHLCDFCALGFSQLKKDFHVCREPR